MFHVTDFCFLEHACRDRHNVLLVLPTMLHLLLESFHCFTRTVSEVFCSVSIICICSFIVKFSDEMLKFWKRKDVCVFWRNYGNVCLHVQWTCVIL